MATDDPLLVRWGLQHLLDGYPGLDSSSERLNSHAQTEFFEPGESHAVRGYTCVENDEIIARTLQEEERCRRFLDLGETSNSAQTGLWSNDYDLHSSYYGESGHEDFEIPEISEDFAIFDGEVKRRLNHLDSIPHVPKTNGDIPTVDDASAAHQRLLDRLKMYGLSELKVDGDGNCQFRALSDQLYRTPECHKSVRNDIVKQLRLFPDFYKAYVPMKYSDYIKKMSRSGEWGDHVTLQAAADFYGVRVCLLTSFKDTCFIEILPRQPKSERVFFLSFWSEVHYNSVYPEGDVPSYEYIKKRSRPFQYLMNKLRP